MVPSPRWENKVAADCRVYMRAPMTLPVPRDETAHPLHPFSIGSWHGACPTDDRRPKEIRESATKGSDKGPVKSQTWARGAIFEKG